MLTELKMRIKGKGRTKTKQYTGGFSGQLDIRGEREEGKNTLKLRSRNLRNKGPHRGPRAVIKDGRTFTGKITFEVRRTSFRREIGAHSEHIKHDMLVGYQLELPRCSQKSLEYKKKERARDVNMGPAATEATCGHNTKAILPIKSV